MDMSPAGLTRAVVMTLRDPDAAARGVLRLELTRRARWDALFLTVVLSTLLTALSSYLSGPGPEASLLVAITPFQLAFSQLVVALAAVGAITVIGRRTGGTGDLDGAIVLVAWLQVVMIWLQLVQTGVMLVSPALAFLIGMAALVLFFWLLTRFIMVLHGFSSAVSVFLGVFGTVVVLGILLSVVLAAIGVAVPEVADV